MSVTPLGRRVSGTVSAALDWGVGASGRAAGTIVRLTVVGEAAAIVSSIAFGGNPRTQLAGVADATLHYASDVQPYFQQV